MKSRHSTLQNRRPPCQRRALRIASVRGSTPHRSVRSVVVPKGDTLWGRKSLALPRPIDPLCKRANLALALEGPPCAGRKASLASVHICSANCALAQPISQPRTRKALRLLIHCRQQVFRTLQQENRLLRAKLLSAAVPRAIESWNDHRNIQ